MSSEINMTDNREETNNEGLSTDISFQYEEYGELELSLVPAFEFSSPISSISSTCSSPDRTTIPESHRNNMNEDLDDDFSDFVSLEELRSQISPPSDNEFSAADTLTKHSNLETIFEDVYLETPPGTPTTSDLMKTRKRRIVARTDLNKCEEFKENVQKNL